MGLGSDVRLARLFADDSRRLFGVAVDHFVGYGNVREGGLADLPQALDRVMTARPDSVTMLQGTAKHLWPRYAGRAALIIQGVCFTVDDRVREIVATPEDAVRLGADALALAIPVRGDTEGRYLRMVADAVREAARFEMPTVAHIYPRSFDGGPHIEFVPDQIAWAVRCGIELGVDVIKVGYPGEEAAFAEIIRSCPVPVVVAGGPKADTLEESLEQLAAAIRCGARGAVIGRNIWGNQDPAGAALAHKAIIHTGASMIPVV
jgi:class I fructose-bisphosphate aldolase